MPTGTGFVARLTAFVADRSIRQPVEEEVEEPDEL
jgi:hypothetical protein